jgi:Uncharacterized protein conserved in bacteria
VTRRAKSFTRTDLDPQADDTLSKSARKRHMHALQNLGDRLAGLEPARWQELALPEALLDALTELRRLKAHEARRRQMQFIGKLMRELDPAPIVAQLERWEAGSSIQKAAFRAAERWRERLLEQTDALAQLLQERPALAAAGLEELILQARSAPTPALRSAAARRLFRLIHEELRLEPATS